MSIEWINSEFIRVLVFPDSLIDVVGGLCQWIDALELMLAVTLVLVTLGISVVPEYPIVAIRYLDRGIGGQ